MKFKTLLCTGITLCLLSTSLEMQAQATRIIASVHKLGNFNNRDSVNYSYAGGLGGEANKTIKFTTDTAWLYDKTSASYNDTLISYQYFDGNNNIIQDSAIVLSAGSWGPAFNKLYTYDANNNMTSYLYQYWYGTGWNNYSNYTYTYDASNNLITSIYAQWKSGAWANSSEDSMTYNSTNQMTYSLTTIWDKTTMAFDINYTQTFYNYDGSGVLTSQMTQKWGKSGSWQNSTQDAYTYDASGVQATDTSFNYSPTLSSWVYGGVDIDSSDGVNVVSDMYLSWYTASSLFVKKNRYLYTFNSNNQLTSSTIQSIIGTNWGYVGNENQYIYYYDTYTGVKQVNNILGSMHLYPNPSSNVINIDATFTTAQPFSVAIYDMQGRIIKQWQEAATNTYHKSIPSNNIASGNYFIVINGENASITKQLVVAH